MARGDSSRSGRCGTVAQVSSTRSTIRRVRPQSRRIAHQKKKRRRLDAERLPRYTEPFGIRRSRFVDESGTTNRSEEHTSELQSRQYLVCRLLLEKKKNHKNHHLIQYMRREY